MAAITKNELHQNTGAAWKRAVELWESYVVNEAWTLTASVTYTDGNGCIRMVINDGTDTTTWNLILLDALDGSVLASAWPGQPGWQHMPGAKSATYGARDTKTDFAAKLVAIRRSLYGFFSLGAAIGGNVNDDLSLPVNGANVRLTHFIVKERMAVWVDWLTCPVVTPTADYEWYGNRVGNEGVVQPSVSIALVSAGGGGGVDVTPIAQAVNDLAHKSVTVELNRGGPIYSVGTREIIEPP